MKCGNLNFLEPSGPLQACNGTALPLPLYDSENVNTIVDATPNKDVNYFWTTTTSDTNDAPDEGVIMPNEFKSKISKYKDLNENQCDQLLSLNEIPATSHQATREMQRVWVPILYWRQVT